jgi:hypothetical protein
MSLLTDNYQSPGIRAYYQDHRRQASAFLLTIGAKALVLEDQKLHELSTYDGIHEEAEMRYRIVNQERIRSIKRKLLEKESIRILKCSRNGKYRMIDVIVEHSKKNETCIVWISKYNYIKKFYIDKNTHISLLEKPPNQFIAQVIDIGAISYSPSQSSPDSPFDKGGISGKNNPSSSTVQTHNYYRPQPYSPPQQRHRHRDHKMNSNNDSNHKGESEKLPAESKQLNENDSHYPPSNGASPPSVSPPPSSSSSLPSHQDIIPVRLRNSHRGLDIFFFNVLEMEAFIMILHRYCGISIATLAHMFCKHNS